jgi:hypothetical protein
VIRGNVARGNVFSGKYVFGKMVYRDMVRGEMVSGEMKIREIVRFPIKNNIYFFEFFDDFFKYKKIEDCMVFIVVRRTITLVQSSIFKRVNLNALFV